MREPDYILKRLKDAYTKNNANRAVARFIYGALVIEYELLMKEKKRNLYLGEGKALLIDEISALSQTIFHLSTVKRFNREVEEHGSPDYTSLFLVTRSLIKVFLTYEHIFLVSSSMEDCFIRFQLWAEYGCTEKTVTRSKKNDGVALKNKLSKARRNLIIDLCHQDPDSKKVDFPAMTKMLTQPLKPMKGWQSLLKESQLDETLFLSIMRFFDIYEKGGPTVLFQNNSIPSNYVAVNPMELDRVHLCLVIVKIVNTHMCQERAWFKDTEAQLMHFAFSNESFDKAYERWIKSNISQKTDSILWG